MKVKLRCQRMSKVEGQETRLGLTLHASGLQPLSSTNGLIYFIVIVIGGVAAVPSWIGDA